MKNIRNWINEPEHSFRLATITIGGITGLMAGPIIVHMPGFLPLLVSNFICVFIAINAFFDAGHEDFCRGLQKGIDISGEDGGEG